LLLSARLSLGLDAVAVVVMGLGLGSGCGGSHSGPCELFTQMIRACALKVA
jgi:hypothetical protein